MRLFIRRPPTPYSHGVAVLCPLPQELSSRPLKYTSWKDRAIEVADSALGCTGRGSPTIPNGPLGHPQRRPLAGSWLPRTSTGPLHLDQGDRPPEESTKKVVRPVNGRKSRACKNSYFAWRSDENAMMVVARTYDASHVLAARRSSKATLGTRVTVRN